MTAHLGNLGSGFTDDEKVLIRQLSWSASVTTQSLRNGSFCHIGSEKLKFNNRPVTSRRSTRISLAY